MQALRWTSLIFLTFALWVPTTGCVSAYKKSIGSETNQTFNRIFLTDFNTAWQASKEALKAIPINHNQEAGTIETKWTDNTAQKNFTDSFGSSDSYLKAQYRVRVSVAKALFNGKPAIKVVVQKDQLIQRDVLEGWRPIETDSIDENTLLYRIGRLIQIKMKIARAEEEKIKKSLESTQF